MNAVSNTQRLSLMLLLVLILCHCCRGGSTLWYVFTDGPSVLFPSCSSYLWNSILCFCSTTTLVSNFVACSGTMKLSASDFAFTVGVSRHSPTYPITAFGISFRFSASAASLLNNANVIIEQLNSMNAVIITTIVQPYATGSMMLASPSCIVVISSSCKKIQFTMHAPVGVTITVVPSQFIFTSADVATINSTCSPTTSILPNFARTSTTVSASTSLASSASISDSCIVSSDVSSTVSRTQTRSNGSPSLSEAHTPTSSTTTANGEATGSVSPTPHSTSVAMGALSFSTSTSIEETISLSRSNVPSISGTASNVPSLSHILSSSDISLATTDTQTRTRR